MKMQIMLVIAVLVLFSSISRVEAKVMVDSHLREWNAATVIEHFDLGADVVEIDIADLGSTELHKVLTELAKRPLQLICIHLKGFSKVDLPIIERFLNANQHLWKQFMFFSGDSAIDAEVRSKYPLFSVARATKQDVIACLTSGLENQDEFLKSCINSDLWIRYSMLQVPAQRKKMKQLAEKIRTHEAAMGSPRTQIALDQIDSVASFCDAVPEFATVIDGIITENFKEIVGLTSGREACL